MATDIHVVYRTANQVLAEATRLSRLVSRLLVLAVIAATSGCWEEIHYTPSPEAAQLDNAAEGPAQAEPLEQAQLTDLASVPETAPPDHLAVEAEPPRAESQPVPSPVAAVEPPAAIQSDDLFGGETAPSPSMEETPPAADHDAASALTAEDPILPTPPETSERIPALGPREAELFIEASSAAEAPSPSTVAPAITPRQRALVWQAASKWSYAQALFAKAVEPRYYEPIRAEAVDAAAQLNVELPPLPMDAADDNREAAVIELLREQGAQSVAAGMQEQFGQGAAALAELAVHSNLLLLTYSPKIAEAAQWAARIHTAAEASGLPAKLWQPLVAQVEQQEDFATVKATVFDLHRRVAQRLKDAAEEALPAP